MGKVVLSRSAHRSMNRVNILDTLESLLFSYPNAFVYLWYHPRVGMWMGASPELFVRIRGENFSTMSLAGTQKVGLKLDPTWGQKEKEEQQMVTDYIVKVLKKHQLLRINIEPTETLKIGELIHLKNTISATVHSEMAVDKLLLDLHPTPAVCGIDKQRAKEFIVQNECYDREFYTGFFGEVNMGQGTDLFVNLRCMQLTEKEIILYAGAGITLASDPIKEWEETQNKLDVLKTKIVYDTF